MSWAAVLQVAAVKKQTANAVCLVIPLPWAQTVDGAGKPRSAKCKNCIGSRLLNSVGKGASTLVMLLKEFCFSFYCPSVRIRRGAALNIQNFPVLTVDVEYWLFKKRHAGVEFPL